jgi:hypothetical protein
MRGAKAKSKAFREKQMYNASIPLGRYERRFFRSLSETLRPAAHAPNEGARAAAQRANGFRVILDGRSRVHEVSTPKIKRYASS